MVIYLVKNLINYKMYIGKSLTSFDERYPHGLYDDTENEDLKKDIEKYGIINFEIDKEFDFSSSRDELKNLVEITENSLKKQKIKSGKLN